MIYLVSKNVSLFESDKYEIIGPDKAVEMLSKERILGADTENEGLDPYTKKMLTIQLGNKDFQIVWDCLSYDVQLLKPILEDPNIKTIWWNAGYDLKFLYHKRIVPENIYDGYIAERLLYLGYPAGMHSMSLKSAGEKYCGIELDKSVRGTIITKGLTEEVIVYAANDVKYEIPIYEAQLEELKKQDLLKAIEFECEFVKVLAYIEYCGVKLDVDRWKRKMENDTHDIEIFKKVLDDWIIASQTGQSTSIGYISLYNRDSKSIEKDRNNPFYKVRVPEKDIKFDSGASYEAYQIEVFPLDIKKKLYYIDPQGDLFTGFDLSPKCSINWASSSQVIPILESLGFKVEEFDKVSKSLKKTASGKNIAKQLDLNSFALPYVMYKTSSKKVESFGQNYLNAINPVSGRIHTNFNILGTDTARVSSGGKPYNINLQQLPRDAETRACFIAEEGNSWISADYEGQESVLTADVSQDSTLLDLFINGCKDMHSMVAKAAFKDELKDVPVEEVKTKAKNLRQIAKSVEFTIFYGGNGDTIASNLGIEKSKGKEIYNNIMKDLPGLKIYQEYCRKEVMRVGYIILNPITKHRAHIYDFDELKVIRDKLQDPEFNQYYWEMKKDSPNCETVKAVRHYMKRKSDSEKQSIDYRIQGRGSACFKLASIKLFKTWKDQGLLFKAKYTIPAHDEINVEVPSNIVEEQSKLVVRCMEEGAKPFLKTLKLTADVSAGKHWIH
jgi:DNA polymerase I-like protein with 3'-5' exonuclease and polymerase domains